MGLSSISAEPVKVLGADPAAGQEVTDTVPSTEVWELLAIAVTFVASAVAGNRIPSIVLDDGTDEFLRMTDRTTIVASDTRKLQASPFAVLPADTTLVHYFVLPHPILLGSGFRIKTETSGILSGDNYAAPIYIVRKYLKPGN